MAQPTVEEASLLGIPIEIRHVIFEHASVRDTKPKKVLRYWFEKREVKEIIAKQVADNPDGVTPQPLYDNDEHEPDSEEEAVQNNEEEGEDSEDEQDDEDDDGEQDEQDDDDQDSEDEEDEAIADGDDQQEEVEAEGQDDDVDQDMADSEDGVTEANQGVQAVTASVTVNDGSTNVQSDTSAHGETAEDMHNDGADPDAGSEADETMDNADDEPMADEEDTEGRSDEDEEMANGDGDITTSTANATQAVPQPPPPAPIVRPHRKWRHIPKFLRMTQCPPPIQLFLLNKQLNLEAKDWFYKVAVLKIDATASFSHQSFFEESLNQVAEAAFSPMENIKKAEVTFVWDTTWLRAESTGSAEAVFPSFLNDRAEHVLRILQQAPELEQIVIHWHDSAEDEEAKATMAGILEPFIMKLKAEVKTETHYISSDSKPNSKSTAGRRRIEFENIIDGGHEAF